MQTLSSLSGYAKRPKPLLPPPSLDLRFEGLGLGIYGKDHIVGSVGNNIFPRNQNKGEDPWRLRFSNKDNDKLTISLSLLYCLFIYLFSFLLLEFELKISEHNIFV